MAVSGVKCFNCDMWEIREASSVPDDYICRKCTQLQLLADRVDRLEQQLDALRSTMMAESIIDRSFRDVVTPKVPVDRWVTARKGRQSVQESPVAIPLSNRYTVLDTVGGDGLPEENSSSQGSGTTTGSAAQRDGPRHRRAIVIGDSIVRGADRRFCGRERDSRMVCCLPGARVKDVSERAWDILKGEGEQPEVVVHIGTNDVGRKSEEVLQGEFRELGSKLKKRTSRVVISGLLPVPRASEVRNRKIVKINTWLKSWCRREGFRYLDNWALFQGRWDLYRKDGLHLNWRGTNILAGGFARVTRVGLN